MGICNVDICINPMSYCAYASVEYWDDERGAVNQYQFFYYADIISALILAALLWHIPGPLTLIAAVLQIGAWTINEVRS